MSLRRTMLTAVQAAAAVLVMGRAVGTTGVAANWAYTNTNPPSGSGTLSRVDYNHSTAGADLYFFIYSVATSKISGVSGPHTSVSGAASYPVSLGFVPNDRLGVRSSAGVPRFDVAGGGGFAHKSGEAVPVVGTGLPGGTTSAPSPQSLNLAGFA